MGWGGLGLGLREATLWAVPAPWWAMLGDMGNAGGSCLYPEPHNPLGNSTVGTSFPQPHLGSPPPHSWLQMRLREHQTQHVLRVP